MGKKEGSSNAQAAERVEQVVELILQGVPTKGIIKFCCEQWSIGERQIYFYIAKATENIRKAAAFDREREMGKAIGRMDKIFFKTYTGGDFKTAIQAQKELNEIFGLKAPTKIVSATVGELTPEDEDRIRNELGFFNDRPEKA